MSLTSRWRPTHALAPLELGLRLRRMGRGPFFSHGYLPPVNSPVPAVVTLHDLMYLRGHGAQSAARAAYMGALRPLYRRCAAVVTMSEAARDDVAEWLDGRVRVVAVGGGVGPQFHPADAASSPDRPVVLYVGSRSDNKNVAGVLGGFEQSAASGTSELWVTGSEQEWSEHVAPFGGRLDGRIRFLGRVADDELPNVYRSASVLLIPSLEEGYGLPALEAMASGVPVVHSTDRALQEVVGGTGIAVEATDWSAIGAGLDAVLTDEVRARDMAARGRERSLTMTWEATANRITELLRPLA